MSKRKTIYRIIKIEGDEEAVDNQLFHSITNDIKVNFPWDLTVSIKDRNDDPCESGFFDSCQPTNGFQTQKQRSEKSPWGDDDE
jgi:hypothetical protein